jgi:hypothetical protein
MGCATRYFRKHGMGLEAVMDTVLYWAMVVDAVMLVVIMSAMFSGRW